MTECKIEFLRKSLVGFVKKNLFNLNKAQNGKKYKIVNSLIISQCNQT